MIWSSTLGKWSSQCVLRSLGLPILGIKHTKETQARQYLTRRSPVGDRRTHLFTACRIWKIQIEYLSLSCLVVRGRYEICAGNKAWCTENVIPGVHYRVAGWLNSLRATFLTKPDENMDRIGGQMERCRLDAEGKLEHMLSRIQYWLDVLLHHHQRHARLPQLSGLSNTHLTPTSRLATSILTRGIRIRLGQTDLTCLQSFLS